MSSKTILIFVIGLLVLGLILSGREKGKKPEKKKPTPIERFFRFPTIPSRDKEDQRPNRGIKRERYEPDEELRDQTMSAVKRRRVEERGEREIEAVPLVPEEVGELERKWMAVLEFRVLQATGKSTNEAIDEIGEKYSVGTGRNVRLLSDYVRDRGSLLRREGSGRPKSVSNRPDIIEFFEEKAKSFNYVFTFEAMANALVENFGVGSTSTVKKIMEDLEYHKTRRVIRPFLTEEHKAERLKWAKEWINFDFFDPNTVVVHIDEKSFYAFNNRGKVAYLPPGLDPEPLYALSKTQIPWVMFLGAVAAPRDDKNFDGKIGLFHVGEEYVAQRKSKFHERGETYWVNINMDGDVFMRIMKLNVIPAIQEKCKWAKKVIVQIDSAGGHRIGETLGALNKIGKSSKPPIIFRTQPTRSPDTNVLDLGIWNSMKSRVSEVRYDRSADATMNQRIIDSVMEMWANYDPSKLNNIFITLKAVLKEIKEHDGGNSFKQPHTIKDHL